MRAHYIRRLRPHWDYVLAVEGIRSNSFLAEGMPTLSRRPAFGVPLDGLPIGGA